MAIYNVNGVTLSGVKDVNNTTLSYAYDVSGNEVFNGYMPLLTFLHSINMSVFNPDAVVSPQGMAVYGNYAFQYFSTDETLQIIDLTDYSIDGSYAVPEFVHGNGLMFGDTIQASGFPLLYASQWGTSEQSESRWIEIAEVGLSSYSISGHYDIPQSAGYHPQFVADWENEKAYTIGYSTSSTASGNMIVSQYNLSDMTSIIKQWNIPYTGVLQGSTFWNKYIIIIGDSYNYENVKITFVDTDTEQSATYQFVKKQDHQMEFQGVDVYNGNLIISSWIYDDEDNQKLKYWLYTMNLPDVN